MSAPNFIDMSGMTIGTLTVLGRAEKTDSRRRVYWNCKCTCGVEKSILGAMLRTGHYKTCGCGKFIMPKGKDNGNWKGGKHVHRGYVQTLVSPGRYVAEHRVVMEGIIGRPLSNEETVHHINGVKNDNRPENLELWKCVHPKGVRVSEIKEVKV